MDQKEVEQIVSQENLFYPASIPGIDREKAKEILPFVCVRYLETRMNSKENILKCYVKDLKIGDGKEGDSVLVFMSSIDFPKNEPDRRAKITISLSPTFEFNQKDQLFHVAEMSIFFPTKAESKTTASFILFGADPIAFEVNDNKIQKEESKDGEKDDQPGGTATE